MKKVGKILIVLIAVSLFGCNTNPQKNGEVETDKNQIENYGKVFKSLKKYLAKENGKLWGEQLYGPILLVDKNDRKIFANEPDSMGLLTKKGRIYVGLLPKEMNIANTATEWNGKRWTMVMLPLPEDRNERLNLLTHELFHRIQPELGFDKFGSTSGNNLDAMDGRIYLKLELEALKKALESGDEGVARNNIRNALSFRIYRDSLYPGEKTAENALELNEGLAEYTGSILSGRNDEMLKEHYIKSIDNFYHNRTFVRSFAYVTIPSYGYFMNKENPNWNREISDTTDLTDYMTGFFHVSVPAGFKDSIDRIKMEYGFDTIAKIENERAEARKKLMKKYEDRFQGHPTLTLNLQNMGIQFDPRNIMPFKDAGTIYPNMRVTDDWGILSVNDGALLSKHWDKVTVSEPTMITDTVVNGSGWKLELNKGWEVIRSSKNYILKKK
ncbi:MAG: hypothetical protein LKK19_03345 [Bacteroidales bacterium]|jgi:hypothetical protein|nr:hypothetical protein [Bacteroidales bacterium]MCI2121721.1 hypothetical protein [Bacteroidales bacterium]MCI2145367.1 hypothetical protein [Bacteroidales bacterium]